MLLKTQDTIKIYNYSIRGAIVAQVRTRKDGLADLFIAARGKVETMPTRQAFDLAQARKRLEQF
jgi:phosphoketolase